MILILHDSHSIRYYLYSIDKLTKTTLISLYHTNAAKFSNSIRIKGPGQKIDPVFYLYTPQKSPTLLASVKSNMRIA